MLDNDGLRVGLVVPALDRGGLELVVIDIYQALVRAGAEATIFVEGATIAEPPTGVPDSDIVVLSRSEEQFFAEIADRRINVVHYHYSTFMLAHVRRAGIRTLYTLHNVYSWLDESLFRAHAEQVLMSNRIVAVSSFAADYFARRARCPRKEIVVIPNGVDVDWITSVSAKSKEQSGLNDDFVFAQFSSFYRVKHHAVLISAAEKLLGERRKFQIVFFGGAGDERYYNEIKRLAAASEAAPYINFFGPVPHKEVAALLKGVVDCAVLTTLQEGCGNAALEAVAAGVPLIMSDTGIAADLLELGADIDVTPSAVPVDNLNYQKIEELSRIGETENLASIVSAMRKRMREGRRTSKKEPAARDFPFRRERMVAAYMLLYHSSQ